MAEIKQLKYFANGEWKTSKTDKYMDVRSNRCGKGSVPCLVQHTRDEACAGAV